jgi:TatD DNase family protein
MLVDTHCHLDAAEFAADRDAVVLAAQTAGVSKIIVPAVGAANFSAVHACCQRYALCYPAYGIHPLYLAQADAGDLSTLQAWLTTEASTGKRPVAVGEIGLDYFVPGFDAARQYDFFIRQLKLARDFDLPVLLHVRRAVDHVLKGLRQVRVRGGIAHAFNGSRQQADAFIALGFKLGFGGAMTYPGSTRIRQLAATLPLDSIVLETDAPDIPPHWLAGRRNEPAALAQIATLLAELRDLSLADVLQATTKNADEIFPTPF